MSKNILKTLVVINLILTVLNLAGLAISVLVLKSLGYTVINLVGLFFNYRNHFIAKEKLDLLEEKEK